MNFISSSSFTLSSLSMLQLSILVSSNPLSPSPMLLLRDRGDAAEMADDDDAALIRRVLTPTISNMGEAAKAEEDDWCEWCCSEPANIRCRR